MPIVFPMSGWQLSPVIEENKPTKYLPLQMSKLESSMTKLRMINTHNNFANRSRQLKTLVIIHLPPLSRDNVVEQYNTLLLLRRGHILSSSYIHARAMY